MTIPVLKMVLVGMLPSFLKVAYYRSRGARIGKGVRLGPLSVLIANDIEIGDDCRIGLLSFIRARKLRLGNRVRIASMVAIDTGEVAIGHDSVIMEQTVVGGMLTPRSSLFVGSRVKIFPYCFINPTEPVVIEDDVGIGGSNYLFTHGSWQNVLDGFPIAFGSIHIRKGVWLPWRVFIMPNVEIGEYATIGAGAVINRSVPPRSLAAGIPAKVISEDGKYLRSLTDEQRWDMVVDIMREMAEFFTYQGRPTWLESRGENWVLRVEACASEPAAKIALLREGQRVPTDVHVVVGMGPLIEADRAYLDAMGKGWFDIGSCLMTLTKQPAVEHVRNFLSRYGVRFAVVSDPVFVPISPP